MVDNPGPGGSAEPTEPPLVSQPVFPAWMAVDQQALSDPYQVSGQEDQLTAAQKSGSLGLLVGIFLLIGVGVTLAVPGLGILMAILAVPPLVRTIALTQLKASQQRSLSTGEQLLMFMGSFGVTLVVSLVVLVSGFGTFCFVCLSAGTESAIPLAALVGCAVTFAVCVPLALWIRARWQRHTQSR